MADIILPDDVFKNMQHAQEAAEKMNAAVSDFNKKVDEKFKEEDASNSAKIKEKVKPLLSADEKKRYSNIGNAFFEGAKNQIVDIIKQIEKNKKKSLFSRAAAAVKEKVQSIKEAANEHKTGAKILLAIAAIGGIYLLFKDWFDKNMPEIWEKMKEAVVSFANGAVSLAEEISKVVAKNDIFQAIKDFVLDTGKTIANFFETIGKTLTNLFSSSGDNKNTITYNNLERLQKEINETDEKYKDNEVVKAFLDNSVNGYYGYNSYVEQSLVLAKEIDELRKAKERGEKTFTSKGKSYDIDEFLTFKTKQLNDFNERRRAILEEAEKFSSDLSSYMENIFKNGNQTLPKNAVELRKAGDMRGAINELLKSGYLQEYLKTADLKYMSLFTQGSLKYVGDTLAANPNWDGQTAPEWYKSDSTARNQFKQAMPLFETITNHLLDQFEGMANTGSKAPDKSTSSQEEEMQKRQKENKTRIQNANYAKLTHVSVITSLDEFVRNFFDGDKPGSFKYFSKTFLESITQIANNFKIATDITKHINSLTDKVNSLTDKVKEISEKFKENNISNLSDRIQDIISKEQEQIDCLVEQNKMLKETNALLSNVSGKNNSLNIINPQNEGKDIVASNMPSTVPTSTAIYYAEGISPYSFPSFA